MWNYALIRYSLFGYAITSCIWVGGTYFFVWLAVAGGLVKTFCDKKIPRFTEPVLLNAILIFLGVMLLSAFGSPDLLDSLKKVWSYFERMIPLFLVIFFIRDVRTLSMLMFGTVLSIVVADSMAVWQGLNGDLRAMAFTSHPMIFAGYLIQIIGALLAMLTSSQWEFYKYRGYLASILGLSLVALLFNGTRGAWIAVFLTTVIFSFRRSRNKKKWLSIVLLVIVCLGILFTTVPNFHERFMTLTDKSFESNSERILLWQSSWHMFCDHPILGIGVGRFYHDYTTQYISPLAVERTLMHAHNNFLQMLVDGGVIGLLGFVYLYYRIVQLSYRNYCRKYSTYSLMVLLVTGCLLLQGLTEFNFGDSVVIRLYWFLTGIGFSSAAYQGVYHRSDESEPRHS